MRGEEKAKKYEDSAPWIYRLRSGEDKCTVKNVERRQKVGVGGRRERRWRKGGTGVDGMGIKGVEGSCIETYERKSETKRELKGS